MAEAGHSDESKDILLRMGESPICFYLEEGGAKEKTEIEKEEDVGVKSD